MSSRGPISQSSSIPSFSLLLVVVVVVVVVFVLLRRREYAVYVVLYHIRERERERSKAVPFFIVLVKSSRHFCVHSTEEQTSQSRVLRRFALSFFFLLKYSALKKKNLTLNKETEKRARQKDSTVQIFFSFSLRSESAHVVETHLERERERESRRNASLLKRENI